MSCYGLVLNQIPYWLFKSYFLSCLKSCLSYYLFSGTIRRFAYQFMPNFISISQLFIYRINSINEWLGKTISWFTLLMVITTFIIVVFRYLFNLGWIALQESVLFMYPIVFMLGAAYTLKHNAHVRVDIIYQQCSAKTKAWIDCVGTLFLLMPVNGFILLISWQYVSDSWSILESSRNSGGLPGIFLLKTYLPIMAVLLMLQGVSMFLKNLLIVLDFKQET